MKRREFSYITTGAALSRVLPSLLAQQQSPSPDHSPISEAAAELYKRALILDCNSGPSFEDGKLPLPLGKEAVKKMNTLGITINLSHANESTTSDVLATSSKPNSLPCRVRRNTPAPAQQDR